MRYSPFEEIDLLYSLGTVFLHQELLEIPLISQDFLQWPKVQ